MNLRNRVADIDEGFHNENHGMQQVARPKKAFMIGCFTLVEISLVATHGLWPGGTPFRVAG